MPCTTNNTLQFKVTMLIEPDKPIKLLLQDLTNYAALGILQSTVKGNFVISDSNGNNIYRNDNFTSPNIIRASTDTVTVTSTVKELDLTGVFYVCYKIQHVDGVDTIEMCELKTYNVCFRPYEPSIFFVQDCFNAALRSEDTTNYTQVNAITTTEQAYVHTLRSTKAAAVNAVNKVATQKFPNLYNETYTATITSTYLYDFANNFSISYKATNSCTYTVDCNLDNCNITCCVECLRKRMNENYLVNPALWEKYHNQFLLATSLMALFEGQIRCGNLTAANKTAAQILELTDCNNGCQDCNCNDSNQIRPFMIACNEECEPCPPCPPVYGNTLISEIVLRDNCPSGFSPNPVTYNLAANVYRSDISQITAQNQAQTFFNLTKQQYANDNGTCEENCAGVGEAAIEGVCCEGLVIQDGICQMTCNSGFTPDVNGVCIEDINYLCNEAVQSGGAGTTTYTYPLNPAGGTFTILVSAFDIPDTFYLSVDGSVVSGSSMTLSNADSAGVLATPIGTDLGAVPLRLAEYVAEIGTAPAIGIYQQILWFTYTDVEYEAFVDKEVVLTIVGSGDTLWNISRFCSELENGGTCQTVGQTVTTECCDALVNDGGVCAVECAEPTDNIIGGVCVACIADGISDGGNYLTCCSGNSADGLCTSLCVPNGQVTGDGNASSCCSGYAEEGLCLAVPPPPTCDTQLGNTITVTTCPEGETCTTVYTGTGNDFTGAGGTFNFGGCEFTITSFNCVPLGDGETCTPS